MTSSELNANPPEAESKQVIPCYAAPSSLEYRALQAILLGHDMNIVPWLGFERLERELTIEKSTLTLAVKPLAAEGLTGKDLRQLLEDINDRDLDVLDLLCAYHTNNSSDLGDEVHITVSQLCALRGLTPKICGRNKDGSLRRSGYTKKQKAEVMAAIMRLSSIHTAYTSAESYQLHYNDHIIKYELDGKGLRYSLGKLIQRSYGETKRQTAIYPRQLYEYNPKTQAYAKRLGKYLYYLARVRATRRRTEIELRLKTLCEAMHLPEGNRPGISVAQIERALQTLTADKLIGGWKYKDTDVDPLRSTVLLRTVSISMPDVIGEHYTRVKRKLPPKKPAQKTK